MVEQGMAKAAVERRGVWRSELLAVVALLVFVGLVVGVDSALRPALGGGALLAAGLVLAVVPAALWLAFFYMQDRLEPEPIGDVARQFVIGAALAGALALPLLGQALRVQDWFYRDAASTAVGALLTGVVETFVVFATVRFFMFESPEFDERVDGVVYGTAAGLGLATAANLQFILASGGAALGPAEVYVAEVALAHGAFGGLMGYFLGRAKMEREPAWWLPAGFALTALLDALFAALRGQLETGSIAVGAIAQASRLPSLTGLLLAGALAVVVTVAVSALVSRDVARTRRGEAAPPAPDAHVGDRTAGWLVVGLAVLLLAAGLAGWGAIVNGSVPFAAGGVSGAYPAGYTQATGDGQLLRVVEPLSGGSSVTIREVAGGDSTAAGTQLAGERGAESAFYRVTERSEATVAGRRAVRQRFAFVETGALVGSTPRVVEGVDYLIPDGGRTLVVTLISDDASGAAEEQFERMVAGLKF